ncbi:ribosomal protein S18-alanine N-acetyltransferase [Tepidibacillus fermentans]|uniref:[Ribosomal protein bS18]-alanine N-acetyltransferase n=1 Tax=Tepidibacillus fermentans TaxID=1281767 RepID=A0A4R3K980_9BACI|nr:ribosomal protein S18-alanine N-acetyltransferase [Tepidibacillus fermentans]TCS79574.1 [SSU ribosomal protein S18P]-alanine acetyltransferase [Tepidibacillus fermentans]
MDMDRIQIRRATIDDIDQIWRVEQLSFPTPWSRQAFFSELTNNQYAYYFVLEFDERIVGYVGMWLIFDEAHITNVAISPEVRGMKLGELLMRYLMATAKGLGANRMTLEVRISNHIAISLYKKLGFKEEGIRKNYYADTFEDAIIMWVNL